MQKKYLYLAIVSLIIAGFISLFASSSPDGLEKVAEDRGFIEAALDYPFATLMPDYAANAISNEYFATAIAGIIGTALVFVFTYLLLKLVLIGKK